MKNVLDELKDLLEKKGIDEKEVAPILSQLKKQLKDKKYGLVWEDKEEDVYKELLNKLPILNEMTEREIKTDKSKPTNLLIEGDNIHSLRSLQYTHKNSINVIYIDPPYSTGNKDFIYNDNFVDKEDTWRHSKWLSFMSKRLQLAKELLSEDGVIFISIDDNEMYQLKLLCDEIFGEENFIANIIWKKNNDNVRKNIKKILIMNEYILCYSKSNLFKSFCVRKELPQDMFNPDNDERGPWFNANISSPINKETEKNVYEVEINGNVIKRRWFYDKDIVEKWISENKIYLPLKKDGTIGVPRLKKFKEDFDNETKIPNNLIMNYPTTDGRLDLEKIFGYSKFSYPKPTTLIKYLINLIPNKNLTVLDFFAGSGTTGHAVLELNKEDCGNRQFILCTNNENNICEEVTYERLNKVINGYTTPKGKEVEGLGGNLKYYKVELEDDCDDIDNTINNIINKCTPLISLRENCYDLIKSTSEYDLISNEERVVLIYKNALAMDYEVEEISEELSNYKDKIRIIYSTNTVAKIKDIEIKEYPKEIIEQQKILNDGLI